MQYPNKVQLKVFGKSKNFPNYISPAASPRPPALLSISVN